MKWMVYLYYIQFNEKTLENHWDSLAIFQHFLIHEFSRKGSP